MRKYKDSLDQHLAEVQNLEKEALRLIAKEMREFRKRKKVVGVNGM